MTRPKTRAGASFLAAALLLPAPAAAEARFFVGDSVVYRYSGSYRGVRPPITLKKTVVALNASVPELLVEFRSGKDVRRWRESRGKLLEVLEGEGATRDELYRDTALSSTVSETVSSMQSSADFCGRTWPVTATITQIVHEGRRLELETRRSPEFVWAEAGASAAEPGGEVVYRADVIECRRPPEAVPPPVKRTIP